MNIIKQGKKLSFYEDSAFTVLEKLENKVYTIEEGIFGPMLFEEEDFKFPSKIYGKETAFVNHVLNYYNTSDKNVAVALVGKKGQGKSLTAKLLCKSSELPVILIKNKASKSALEFLASIDQNFVVFVDEFEKIYNTRKDEDDNVIKDSQEVWLSILDGNTVFKGKVLFVFTSNEELNTYLVDRPSRIRYMKKYDALDKDVVLEYLNDNLNDKSKIEDIMSKISLKNINLDIVSELVKEINSCDLTVSEIFTFFNYNPNVNVRYNIDVYNEKGEEIHSGFVESHNEITSESYIRLDKEFLHEDKKYFLYNYYFLEKSGKTIILKGKYKSKEESNKKGNLYLENESEGEKCKIVLTELSYSYVF